MSKESKAKTKAQKKKEKERLARAQMTQELNLIQQLSKSTIHPSASAPGDLNNATSATAIPPATPARGANQSGGSSGSPGNTPPQTAGAAAGAANASSSNKTSLLPTNLWPPTPKIPIGQSLSYGWKIPFPANGDSIRPNPLGSLGNNRAESQTQLAINSGGLSRYKEERRRRYVKAARESGLNWDK